MTVRREMVPFLAMAAVLGLLILIVASSNLGGLLLARLGGRAETLGARGERLAAMLDAPSRQIAFSVP